MMGPFESPVDDCSAASGQPASWSVAMTDRGLVCGAGSVLARMKGEPGQPQCLAADVDEDRLVAMLSVVAGRPLPAANVMHHVEAASAHWLRGDKALANLRLVFARFPRPVDAAAVDRLALTEHLIDDGLAPDRLMKALWPLQAETLRRYYPDQPRVPAGYGVESGRWRPAGGEGANATSAGARLVVAANPGGVKGESFEEEKLFEERDMMGLTTFEEEVAHGRPIDPFEGLPFVGMGRPRAIDNAAKDAFEAAGPGRGPAYGTKVHTQFRNNIRALEDPNILSEQSYLNGRLTEYGTKGSVRADVVEGPAGEPSAVHDLKTGGARLSAKRLEQLRTHLPDGRNIPIREIKQ